MHLGMSGSFRVENNGRATADPYYYARDVSARHDHVVFQMSSGATVVFNDPRRFGFMDIVSREALSARRGVGQLGPEPLSDEFDAEALARACREEDVAQGRAVRPACRRWPGQHLRVRGAASCAALTASPRVHHRNDCRRAARSSGQARGSDQESASDRHRRPRRGPVPRLRSPRRALPHARLPRSHPAHHAGRSLDVLLSGVSEVGPKFEVRSAIDCGGTWVATRASISTGSKASSSRRRGSATTASRSARHGCICAPVKAAASPSAATRRRIATPANTPAPRTILSSRPPNPANAGWTAFLTTPLLNTEPGGDRGPGTEGRVPGAGASNFGEYRNADFTDCAEQRRTQTSQIRICGLRMSRG